jgi:hypothetical protein
MNRHPYLRAYMAGVTAPTAFLLVVLSIFCIERFVFSLPAPLERAMVFPMAVVPNLFGAWNMLFVKLHQHWRVPIGLHGAALPFFIGPAGFVFFTAMGFLKKTAGGLEYFGMVTIPYWVLPVFPFIAIALYYLAWKYLVGYLNRVMELPC